MSFLTKVRANSGKICSYTTARNEVEFLNRIFHIGQLFIDIQTRIGDRQCIFQPNSSIRFVISPTASQK
jgi:hypothetical protein